MCSFEVYHVGVHQKVSKWEGGSICKNGHFSAPPICSFSKLHQHNIPQKNTFLMYEKDLKNQFRV